MCKEQHRFLNFSSFVMLPFTFNYITIFIVFILYLIPFEHYPILAYTAYTNSRYGPKT